MDATELHSTTLTAIAEIAAQPTVWMRIAVVCNSEEAEWNARTIELITGEPPPDWAPDAWNYPRARFVSLELPGSTLARMLAGGAIDLPEGFARMPALSNARTERHPLHFPSAYQPLPWPSDDTVIWVNQPTPGTETPQGHLLSDDGAPSFLDYTTAAQAFFRIPGDRRDTPTPEIVHRHQDRSGRIAAVRILAADDQVEVRIEGDALAGLTLDLAGNRPGATVTLPRDTTASHDVVFSTNQGLPAGAWLVLRAGSRYVDRWYLNPPFGHRELDGLEIVVDERSRLEALVAAWERVSVEFKRQVPVNEESKFRLMKTICAFANGDGGSILIGVDDDDRSFAGLHPRAIDSVKGQLGQMVRSWVEPEPPLTFNTLPIPDSSDVVLEMLVGQGTSLYACGKPSESRRPYVRHQASTETATRAESVHSRGSQVTGAGNQGVPASASRMASMARMPCPAALTT